MVKILFRSGILLLLIGRLAACLPDQGTPTATEPVPPPASTITASAPAAQSSATPSTSASPAHTPYPPEVLACLPDTEREEAVVTGVVDGDTIHIRRAGGATESLRYIGIDTPERGSPYFEESSRENKDLVLSQTVQLITDVSAKDRYGRLLRYVLAGDVFVNYELVRRGYATAVTFPPDVACAEVFRKAERQAREEKDGLWGLPQQPTATRLAGTPAACDPAYPEVCIPSPPPDLDCKDIPYRKFKVLPPDPHNFDVDQNGIGCEQP